MRVSELFFSIQGEGVTMGQPAIFLRTQTCNLRCIYCDTKHTWNPKEGKEMTFLEVAEKVKKLWKCESKRKKRRLVITGGEPLLFKDEIDKLIKLLRLWTIEIETNGTIMPTDYMLKEAKIYDDKDLILPHRLQFNCSPKLENSGNPIDKRIVNKVLRVLSQDKLNSYFKFVVSKEKDLKEVEKIFVKRMKIPIKKIILMPLGISTDELRESANNIVEYAKKKGYRILGRLHIDIWGNRKGI